jgi:hypothetical protein
MENCAEEGKVFRLRFVKRKDRFFPARRNRFSNKTKGCLQSPKGEIGFQTKRKGICNPKAAAIPLFAR